jgi:hypothetical protein
LRLGLRRVDAVDVVGPHRLRRAVEDDAALREPDDAVGELARVVDLVQVAQHRDAQVARGVVQVLQHLARGLRVEAGDRLVREDQPRLLRQRAGDAHALHLPARERVGARVRLVRQAHAGQALVRQRDVGAAEEVHHRRERRHRAQAPGEHVLQRGEARHHVVVLEDHGHALAQGARVGALHRVHAVDVQLAAVGHREAVHAAQQGRLAGARLAEHHHELARRRIEVHAAQHGVVAVALGELPDADHFMLRRSSLSTLAVSRTTS